MKPNHLKEAATKKNKEVDLQHMPQFIKDTPWYLNQDSGEALHHQRQKQTGKKQSIYTYHHRGLQASSARPITKFR